MCEPTRRLLAALLLAFLCGSCTPTKEPHTATTPAAWSVAENGLFLWRVERDKAVSYVFGTIHAGVNLAEMSSLVVDKLSLCDTLVVEADASEADAAFAKTVLPPEQSLRGMLGEKHWASLLAHMGDEVDPASLDRFRPWVVSVMLTVGDLLDDSSTSLDQEIVQHAKASEKTIEYLETVGEQFDMLDRIMGIDELKETIDDVPSARHELHALIRAYRMGNFPALAGIMLDPQDMAEDPDSVEILLYARNRAWMRALEPLLRRGNVFVAVGAGHYVGSDGLLALLERAGFRVQRVAGPVLRE